MKVEIDVTPWPGIPPVAGPHELAWSYILDHVFADAYAAGLAELRVVVPAETLREDLQIRSELTPGPYPSSGIGSVYLTGSGSPDGDACRLYTLEFGRLAGRSLRGHRMKIPAGWKRHQRLSVYTWKALVLGVPIRAANTLHRPALADRAIYAMRRHFSAEGTVPAYYHLSIWVPQ